MEGAETEAPVVRWGLGDAIAGAALALVASSLALATWAAATGQSSVAELSFAGVLVAQIGLWLGYLGAPLWACFRKGTGRLADDFGLVIRARDAVVGVPIGLVCQLVLVPLVYLPFRSFEAVKDLDDPAKDLADKAHGPAFLLLALLLVVAAPVIEELFFRGLLLRSLARRWGDTWALAGSAVVFGVVHFEAVQTPALILVGAVFGYLAIRYRRLGPGIFAHAAFNLVVVISLALER